MNEEKKKFIIGEKIKVINGKFRYGEVGYVEKVIVHPDGKNVISVEFTDTTKTLLGLPERKKTIASFNEGDIQDYDEYIAGDYITEMAGRIPGVAKVPGKPKGYGLIIAMGDKERSIRHFHIYRSQADKESWSNGACLYLNENKYYDHGRNKGTLDEDELLSVIEKLKSQHPTLGVSNWKYLVALWNDNNPNYPIDPNLGIPPYNVKTITRYSED